MKVAPKCSLLLIIINLNNLLPRIKISANFGFPSLKKIILDILTIIYFKENLNLNL
jgi:hypothetical protein